MIPRVTSESDPGFQSKMGARFRPERISMLRMVNTKNNHWEFSCIPVSYEIAGKFGSR